MTIRNTARICVATVTRNRPVMLRSLLQSYEELKVPAGATVDFVIVENDAQCSLDAVVANFAANAAGSVAYLVETEIGIAAARNRALEHALANDYDFLAFADDDEWVEPDWLVQLLEEAGARHLDIVGAPVRIAAPDALLSLRARIVLKGVRQINERAEQRCIRLRAEGRDQAIKIATGSWLGRLDFFRRTGLRFDRMLGLAGGEDWQLWQEAQRLGARTGWTPHAMAYETIPLSRLTLHYFYRRNRDHSRQMSMRVHALTGNRLKIVSSSVSRLYKVFRALLSLPVGWERSLLTAVANAGSFVGFVEGAFGIASTHYRTTDGH